MRGHRWHDGAMAGAGGRSVRILCAAAVTLGSFLFLLMPRRADFEKIG